MTKTWQERVDQGFETCDQIEAMQQEIDELRAALGEALSIFADIEAGKLLDMGGCLTKEAYRRMDKLRETTPASADDKSVVSQ